jgi:hypothetical protein
VTRKIRIIFSFFELPEYTVIAVHFRGITFLCVNFVNCISLTISHSRNRGEEINLNDPALLCTYKDDSIKRRAKECCMLEHKNESRNLTPKSFHKHDEFEREQNFQFLLKKVKAN